MLIHTTSTWKQHKVSKMGEVGCSPISLYALRFLLAKSKEQTRTLSSTRPCWGGYNKQLVVLYHTLLWEQNCSSSDLKQDVTLFKTRLYSIWVSPIKAQSCDSFSSIFQSLLSHNHCIWKDGCVISSVHQTRYSEVPTTTAAKHSSSGCTQHRGRAASCVLAAGPATPGMFVRKSAAAHVWLLCAKGMLMHCFGNNNISVSTMSYFIKYRVAEVLEQLLCLCRMLNTQSDHLFSMRGKICPLSFLNTLKLLLVCLKQHMKVLLLSNILSYSGLHSLPKLSCLEISVKQVCIFETYYRHRDNVIRISLQHISFLSQILIL